MHKAGFDDLAAAEVPAASVQALPPPAVFGGIADRLIAQILADAPAVGQPTSSSQSRQDALNNCATIAGDIKSPLQSYVSWLTEVQNDLSERLVADHRVQEANRTLGNCISGLGYSANDGSELVNLFASRVRDVSDRMDAGSITKDVALEELNKIGREEDAIAPSVIACITQTDNVEQQVLAELEDEFISKNGEIVRAELKSISDRLPSIAEFLPQHSSSQPVSSING